MNLLVKQQQMIESEFHTIWNQYMGAADFGLLRSPFLKLHEFKSIKKPSLEFIVKGVQYAGRYFVQGNRMIINLAYYQLESEQNIEGCKTTIAHEFAHHIQWCAFPHFKQWHGPEFRYIMNSIGYDGKTYHNHSVAAAKSVAERVRKESKPKPISIIDLL